MVISIVGSPFLGGLIDLEKIWRLAVAFVAGAWFAGDAPRHARLQIATRHQAARGASVDPNRFGTRTCGDMASQMTACATPQSNEPIR